MGLSGLHDIFDDHFVVVQHFCDLLNIFFVFLHFVLNFWSQVVLNDISKIFFILDPQVLVGLLGQIGKLFLEVCVRLSHKYLHFIRIPDEFGRGQLLYEVIQ